MFEKHGDTRFDFLREATEGDPPDLLFTSLATGRRSR